MKRLLLIIPLILAVVLYAGFRTGGYRTGATYPVDFTFEDDLYVKDTLFAGGVVVCSSTVEIHDDVWHLNKKKSYWTDGLPGADTASIDQGGIQMSIMADNKIVLGISGSAGLTITNIYAEVQNYLTVKGETNLGDAATDTITCTGLFQANAKSIFNDASVWMLDDSLFFTDGTAASPGVDTSGIVQDGTNWRFFSDNTILFNQSTLFNYSTTHGGSIDGNSDGSVIRWDGYKWYNDYDADNDTVFYCVHGTDGLLRYITASDQWEFTESVVVNGGINYAADAQGDDDYEVAIPGISALTEGLTVTFKANTANTDGATLEITSVGDLDAILKLHDTALATNDIKAGAIVVVVFDGSDWQMVSQLSQ